MKPDKSVLLKIDRITGCRCTNYISKTIEKQLIRQRENEKLRFKGSKTSNSKKVERENILTAEKTAGVKPAMFLLMKISDLFPHLKETSIYCIFFIEGLGLSKTKVETH